MSIGFCIAAHSTQPTGTMADEDNMDAAGTVEKIRWHK